MTDKNYAKENPHMRLTDCCSVVSTYMDDGTGTFDILSCKNCYEEVGIGEGDGNEFNPIIYSEQENSDEV